MKRELLLIIDMVNGFVKFGALADPKINKITPNIIKLIEEFKANGQPIVAFRDVHREGDKEIAKAELGGLGLPEHCMEGSGEELLIDELKPYEKDFAATFEKNVFNGLEIETIKTFFTKNEFDRVVVVGCCTDICVQQFTLGSNDGIGFIELLETLGRKTEVVVPENAVATYHMEGHDAAVFHNNALKLMEASGAKVERGLTV